MWKAAAINHEYENMPENRKTAAKRLCYAKAKYALENVIT